MERLSLNAFKEKAIESKQEDLENLTGGVLGACHCDHCGGECVFTGLYPEPEEEC